MSRKLCNHYADLLSLHLASLQPSADLSSFIREKASEFDDKTGRNRSEDQRSKKQCNALLTFQKFRSRVISALLPQGREYLTQVCSGKQLLDMRLLQQPEVQAAVLEALKDYRRRIKGQTLTCKVDVAEGERCQGSCKIFSLQVGNNSYPFLAVKDKDCSERPAHQAHEASRTNSASDQSSPVHEEEQRRFVRELLLRDPTLKPNRIKGLLMDEFDGVPVLRERQIGRIKGSMKRNREPINYLGAAADLVTQSNGTMRMKYDPLSKACFTVTLTDQSEVVSALHAGPPQGKADPNSPVVMVKDLIHIIGRTRLIKQSALLKIKVPKAVKELTREHEDTVFHLAKSIAEAASDADVTKPNLLATYRNAVEKVLENNKEMTLKARSPFRLQDSAEMLGAFTGSDGVWKLARKTFDKHTNEVLNIQVLANTGFHPTSGVAIPFSFSIIVGKDEDSYLLSQQRTQAALKKSNFDAQVAPYTHTHMTDLELGLRRSCKLFFLSVICISFSDLHTR